MKSVPINDFAASVLEQYPIHIEISTNEHGKIIPMAKFMAAGSVALNPRSISALTRLVDEYVPNEMLSILGGIIDRKIGGRYIERKPVRIDAKSRAFMKRLFSDKSLSLVRSEIQRGAI